MKHTTRTTALLTAAIVSAGFAHWLGTGPVEAQTPAPVAEVPKLNDVDPVEIAEVPFTTEQQELIDFAYARYARAGLVLPDVSISFSHDDSHCFGYGGVYLPEEMSVRICRPSKTTMIHELAHAWVETVLAESDRQAFLDLRDLETWRGGDEWAQRGAEQAAEIITWGLMDSDISVRWLVPASDGTSTETRRLFKVPNTGFDQLVAAYDMLTHALPTDRIADSRIPRTTVSTVVSPEARKPAA